MFDLWFQHAKMHTASVPFISFVKSACAQNLVTLWLTIGKLLNESASVQQNCWLAEKIGFIVGTQHTTSTLLRDYLQIFGLSFYDFLGHYIPISIISLYFNFYSL